MVKLQNSKSHKTLKSANSMAELKKSLNVKQKSKQISRSKGKENTTNCIAIKKSTLVDVSKSSGKLLKKQETAPVKVSVVLKKNNQKKDDTTLSVNKKEIKPVISEAQQKKLDEKALFGEESEDTKPVVIIKNQSNLVVKTDQIKKAPQVQQQRSKSPIIINKYKIGPFSEPPISQKSSKQIIKKPQSPPSSKVVDKVNVKKVQTLEVQVPKPKFANQSMIKNLSDIQLYEQLNSEEDRERIQKVLERYEQERVIQIQTKNENDKIKEKLKKIYKPKTPEKTVSDDAKRKVIAKKSYTPTKDIQSSNQKSEPKSQSNEKSPKTVEKSKKRIVTKKSLSPDIVNPTNQINSIQQNDKKGGTKKRVEKNANKQK